MVDEKEPGRNEDKDEVSGRSGFFRLMPIELDFPFILGQMSKGKCLDESIESFFVERMRYSVKYSRSKLVPKYRIIFYDTMREIMEYMPKLISLLKRTDLDQHWMMAEVSLSIQDISVQRAVEKQGIPIKEEGRYKNTPKLLGEIEPLIKCKGLKTTDLKIARAYSEDFRNDVIHRGQKVDEKRASEILNNTMGLLNLFSEYFFSLKYKLVHKEDWGYKEPED